MKNIRFLKQLLNTIQLCIAIFVTVASPRFAQADLAEIPAETIYAAEIHLSEFLWIAPLFSTEIMGASLNDFQKSEDPLELFLSNAFDEIFKRSHDGTLSELGINPKSTVLSVYGIGIWPVLSLQLEDSSRFQAWLFDHLGRQGLQPKSVSEGQIYSFRCDPSEEVSCRIAFDHGQNRLKLALILSDKENVFTPYLLGKESLSGSLQSSGELDGLKAKYESDGKSFALFNQKRLVQTLTGKLIGLNADLLPLELKRLSSQLPPSCEQEYIQLIDLIPYTFLGYHQTLTEKRFRFVLPLNGALSRLHELSTSEAYSSQQLGELMHFNMAFNFQGLIQLITDLNQYLTSQPFRCPHLQRGQLNEVVAHLTGQLSMVPPLFSGIRGFSFALKNIEIPPMQKESTRESPSIDAALLISATQAPMLLQMLKGFVPQFAQATFPTVDGPASPIQGLELPPTAPPHTMMIKSDGIGLGIGEQSVSTLPSLMTKEPRSAAPLFYLSYNFSRFMAMLMEMVPKEGAQIEEIKAMFSAIEAMEVEKIWTMIKITRNEFTIDSVNINSVK